MISRLSAVHLVWRAQYFSCLDLLTSGHYRYQINCTNILNQTLEVIFKNAGSLYCFDKIMPKRRAIETQDLNPPTKKKSPEMATGLNRSSDSNNSADSSKQIDSLPTMSSTSSGIHKMTAMSSAACLEDSGIEVTPVFDRALARVPGMPGFLLNPPKPISVPKFDSTASDVYHSEEKEISHKSSEVNSSSTSVLEKEPAEDSKSKDNCAVSSVASSRSCETESTLNIENPGSGLPVDKSKMINVSMVACIDLSPGTANRGEYQVKTSDKVETKISDSVKHFAHADKVRDKGISTAFSEDGHAQRSKEEHMKGKISEKAVPVVKLLKSPTKKPVVATEHKRIKTSQSLQAVQAVKPLKTTTQRPIVATEHQASESQTSKAAKGSKEQSSTSSRQVTQGTARGVEQTLSHQAKHASSPSHTPTRKRGTAQRNNDHAEVLVSTGKRSVKERQEMGEKVADKSSEKMDAKKRKKTVLPESLLKDVVKTVQTNVGTISMQVVAASASKSSLHTAPALTACSRKDMDSVTTDTKSIISGVNNRKCDANIRSKSSVTNTVTQDATGKSAGHKNGGQKSKPKKEPIALKSANQDTMQSRAKPEKSKSATQVENRDDGKEETKAESTASPCSKPSGQTSQKSLETSTEDASPNNDKSVKNAPDTLANTPDSFETNMESIPPVKAEKPSTDEIQKAKKKAKKKKKQSKRQRKSTEGDRENLLGVLPEYVPENDSRLKKRKEDKVYNLSALFSGQLLKHQPSPKRSRPNYFFAVQITNPEIKTGFSAVQQEVEDACPKLKAAFVSVESAHLTLGVMHLPDEESVARVISLMEEFRVVHQNQRLQKKLALEEQGQGQELSMEDETVADDHPPFSSSLDSAEHNSASAHVKNHTADSDTLKSSDSKSVETLTPEVDSMAVTSSSDSVKTTDDSVRTTDDSVETTDNSVKTSDPVTNPVNYANSANPVNTNSASSINAGTSDSAKTNSTDPVADPGQVDSTLSLKRNVADSVEKGSAEAEKSDPAGGEKTDPTLTLEVKGLDTFGGNVVFAKVVEGAALDEVKAVADRLTNDVLAQDISMDSKPFAPHITLMKMSKNPGKLKASGIKKIDSKLYQDFKEAHFGSNAVTTVQLCAMLKPKQNGYYHIEHEIPLS